MTFSVSYRIADLKWIYRIVSYRHRLSCCIASEHGYRLLSYRALSFCTGLYSTERLQPGGQTVNLSSYRKLSPPSPNRIVSYRIVLAGLSSLSVSRVIANRTYRKVSYRHLSCTYRIVSYRQIQGHDPEGPERMHNRHQQSLCDP